MEIQLTPCPTCGTNNATSSRFCGNCGAALNAASPETEQTGSAQASKAIRYGMGAFVCSVFSAISPVLLLGLAFGFFGIKNGLAGINTIHRTKAWIGFALSCTPIVLIYLL
jgi:hypothetical protein